MDEQMKNYYSEISERQTPTSNLLIYQSVSNHVPFFSHGISKKQRKFDFQSSKQHLNQSNQIQQENQSQRNYHLFQSSVSQSGKSNFTDTFLRNKDSKKPHTKQAQINQLASKNQGFFQNYIVKQIIQSQKIPSHKKIEVIDIYRALCVFSTTNIPYYKRLIRHQSCFPLEHGDNKKNIPEQTVDKLPKLRELLKAHLQIGAGIQNIRGFYQNQHVIKDQYATLIHAILRIIFSKIRDFILYKYPQLDWLLTGSKNGSSKLNYSNAVSLALLHANKQFSPAMSQCYIKVAKVIFFNDGIQDIALNDVQALFQLLRQKNQQNVIPSKSQRNKQRKASQKNHSKRQLQQLQYIPYNQPQYDTDFQIFKPSSTQIFERCDNFSTKHWSLKFQKYVMALYMKHQNFLDVKQILNQQYSQSLGYQLDLQEVKSKFQIAMKKIILYLQLQLHYIIRRTNISKVSNYKVDFWVKKFLTLNKNQKRSLFVSEYAKNCRLFMIDYYLNNFQRRSKSYKMILINYRLGYLDFTIQAVMIFLQSKIGQSGILVQSQLEKQDTYSLKLITNPFLSILKSILKAILVKKAILNSQIGQKLVKNSNARRAICSASQVEKLFQQLKPDDLMQIQVIYLKSRNKSLIVKKNPKQFNYKVTQSLQGALVEEECQTLQEIIARRGREYDEQEESRREKFEMFDSQDVQNQDLLKISKSNNKQSKAMKTNNGNSLHNDSSDKNSQSSKFNSRSRQGSIHQQEQSSMSNPSQDKRKKDFEKFMKALKQSKFIQVEQIILRRNIQRNFFKDYFK